MAETTFDPTLPFVYAGTTATAAVLLPVTATILTLIRFHVRVRSEIGLGADDWMILPALASIWALGAAILHGIAQGIIGYPQPPMFGEVESDEAAPSLPPGLVELGKFQYGCQIIMVLAFGWIKLAVLLFYRRVFTVGSRSLSGIVVWVLILVSATWMLAFFLLMALQCGSQPSLFWTSVENPAQCLNAISVVTALGASDLATDIAIFFFPLPILWSLQMPLRKKLRVTLALAIGSLSLIASALRFTVNVETLKAGYAPADFYLTTTLLFYWTMVEAGIALVAINLSTLPQFLATPRIRTFLESMRTFLTLKSAPSQDPLPDKESDLQARAPTKHKASLGTNVEEVSQV